MTRTAEIDDSTWAVLEPLLPCSDGRPGRPFRDTRQVVEGIVHRYRAGLAWRDLPERFGPWQTVWKRHHRYSVDGTWDKVLTVLQSRADAAGDLDWTVSIDSTVTRVHQHAATLPRSDSTPGEHTGGTTE